MTSVHAVQRGRAGFVGLAVALFLACALLATWPAVRHAGSGYLARPAVGLGEAAAGDHLQLAWAFWLPGHELSRGAAPWRDPYSFRPESRVGPNLQGWLLGPVYWPLDRLFGRIWAYNLIVLASFAAAGGLACRWLRSLGISRSAALVGGVVFALAPYRVGQSTGHLLGLIAFLLPAVLLALERRRFVWAALALASIPLSGQLHLALGAIVMAAGYAWARLPRAGWWRAGTGLLAASLAGVVVQRVVVAGSVAGGGRDFAEVRRYSAELSDFVTRGVGAGIEEFVFVGWLTPFLALCGLWVIRRSVGLACFLGLSALLPAVLALGSNAPVYEPLWRVLPPLQFARVPERLLPISALALAALVAFFVDSAVRSEPAGPVAVTIAAVAIVLLAADTRVPVFGAVEPDRASAAYSALKGPGRLFELPVFRPGIHYGSAYLAYARQSPRERPQGYSTTAKRPAEVLARDLRGISCGRGAIPPSLGVRFVVVHRALYRQSGWFADTCPQAAEDALRRRGWKLLARDGPISSWER